MIHIVPLSQYSGAVSIAEWFRGDSTIPDFFPILGFLNPTDA